MYSAQFCQDSSLLCEVIRNDRSTDDTWEAVREELFESKGMHAHFVWETRVIVETRSRCLERRNMDGFSVLMKVWESPMGLRRGIPQRKLHRGFFGVNGLSSERQILGAWEQILTTIDP